MKKLTLPWLRQSLAKWMGKLSYRRSMLARARREARRGGGVITAAEATRIKNWKHEVAKAEAMVAKRRRQIAIRSKVQPSRLAVVRKARSYIGVSETYPNGGGIINTWQKRLGFGNVAWCGIFCANMLMQGGIKNVTPRLASVALIEDDARQARGCFAGWTTNESIAKPGDLVVIGSYGQHVGMVDDPPRNPDGSLNTIEGNCGNAVRRMRRSRSVVRGIARLRVG